VEEAAQVLSSRGHAAALKGLIDRGEAATKQEAAQVLGKRAYYAAVANHPLGETGFNIQRGIATALSLGKYTRYPGVHWRKDTRNWRVQFGYKGKSYNVGSYDGEVEAALAHDDFVRTRGFNRPLHFPAGENEVSSSVFREMLKQA